MIGTWDTQSDLEPILVQLGDLLTRYRALTAQLDRLLEDLAQIERDIAAQRTALETLCSGN